MPQFNLQKTMLGSLLFFVEQGLSIDGVSVSKSAKPDVDPTTNWRSLGCANDLTPYRVTEDDTPFKCFDGNRFRQDTTTVVLEDGWEFSLESHCEPIYRLMLGLSAEVVDDTPVIPYAENIREIYGWLKFQARNVNKKGDVWVMDLWGKLEMIELPTYNDKSVFPRMRFTSETSGLNVIELTNVANLPDS
ncbi:MAG: hypothetical protein PVJ98_10275 [Akkermansiaceae bacterium]|jgi:hypothetical protein